MLNAEFRKNVWSELTATRLILPPLIIAGIFLVIFLSREGQSDIEKFENFMIRMDKWSLLIVGFIVFVIGSRIVSDSVIREVNGRTWLAQRMTSIGPWEMTFGKLFGSNVYSWYSALFGIIAYIIAAIFLPNTLEELKFLFLILMIGLFIHTVILLMSFIGIRRSNYTNKIHSTVYFIIGLLLTAIILDYVFSIHDSQQIIAIKWFVFKLALSDFLIFSAIFFTVWAIIGLYRSLRTELHLNNGPLAWILFQISLMVYFSGFISNINALSANEAILIDLYISYLIAILVTYFMAFNEPKNIVNFRLLFINFKERNWKRLRSMIPIWIVSLVLTVLIAIAIALYTLLGSELDFLKSILSINFLFPLIILLFVLRDICILLFVNFSIRFKKSDLTTFFLLIIMYVLFSTIITLANKDFLLPIFIPYPKYSASALGILPAFAQFAFVLYLLIRRLRLIF